MYDAGAIATVQQVCEYLAWAENDLSLRPVLAESWTPDADGEDVDVQAPSERHLQQRSGDDRRRRRRHLQATGRSQDRFVSALQLQGHPLFRWHQQGRRHAPSSSPSTVRSSTFPYLVSSSNYNCVILPEGLRGDLEKNPVGTGPFTLECVHLQADGDLQEEPDLLADRAPVPRRRRLHLRGRAGADAAAAGGQPGHAALDAVPGFAGAVHRSEHQDRLHAVHADARGPDARGQGAVRQQERAPGDRLLPRPARASCRPSSTARGCSATTTCSARCIRSASRSRSAPRTTPRPSSCSPTPGMTSLEVQLVAEEYLEVPQYAQIIQQMCKPAGINVKIQLQSQAQFYGKDQSAPWLTVPFGITDWAARAIPSQFFIPMLTSDGVWNNSHWKQPAVRLASRRSTTRRSTRPRARTSACRWRRSRPKRRRSSSRTGSRCCAPRPPRSAESRRTAPSSST